MHSHTPIVRPATWLYHLPGFGSVLFSVVRYPDRVLARKAGSLPNRTQLRTCCVLCFRITHSNDPAVASVNNGLIPSILAPLRPVHKWRPLVSRMAGTCCRTVLYLPCPMKKQKTGLIERHSIKNPFRDIWPVFTESSHATVSFCMQIHGINCCLCRFL